LVAQTYYVATTGDDSNSGTSEDKAFRTLNHTFLFAGDQDTVFIGQGVFTITRPLEWMGSLAIIGEGADKTIIQASEKPDPEKRSVYSHSVFYNQKYYDCTDVVPESILMGMTVQYGDAPASEPLPTSVGGGIKNFASLTISDCIIQYNRALNGGAIYNDGVLKLENSIIRWNHALNLEGAVFNTPGAVYSESACSFMDNTQDSGRLND
jgi:hypothetical protein